MKIATLVLLAGWAFHGTSMAADPGLTGLIGQTFTMKVHNPKDQNQSEIAPGYFSCGGALLENPKDLALTFFRKGRKSDCQGSNRLLAVTIISNNGATLKFLDVLELNVPKGFEVVALGCKGADLAIAKMEDKEVLTKHQGAWKVQPNGKFQAVPDLKKVRCENQGYGV